MRDHCACTAHVFEVRKVDLLLLEGIQREESTPSISSIGAIGRTLYRIFRNSREIEFTVVVGVSLMTLMEPTSQLRRSAEFRNFQLARFACSVFTTFPFSGGQGPYGKG